MKEGCPSVTGITTVNGVGSPCLTRPPIASMHSVDSASGQRNCFRAKLLPIAYSVNFAFFDYYLGGRVCFSDCHPLHVCPSYWLLQRRSASDRRDAKNR